MLEYLHVAHWNSGIAHKSFKAFLYISMYMCVCVDRSIDKPFKESSEKTKKLINKCLCHISISSCILSQTGI